MVAIAPVYKRPVPSYIQPPKVLVRFRILRDGGVTAEKKRVRVFRGWGSVSKLDLAFEAKDGEFSLPVSLDLATMLAQGEWLVTGVDPTPPQRTRAAYMDLSESGTYTFNITSGEGGGSDPGAPAVVEGIVRVERTPADRPIVVLERPDDGEWRVAGHGPAPDGNGTVPVRIVGGSLYAISIDDWGVEFSSSLAVLAGQRIRPTHFSGWLYEITEPGTLPTTEPQWWPVEGENPSRSLGTARAVAVRYYRPLAHGPVPVERL